MKASNTVTDEIVLIRIFTGLAKLHPIVTSPKKADNQYVSMVPAHNPY